MTKKNMNIDTIFKLIPYNHSENPSKNRYPTLRLGSRMAFYFRTKEDAEAAIKDKRIEDPFGNCYCWALREFPLGAGVHSTESLSERIYLPDGQLWSERLTNEMYPDTVPHIYDEIEFYDYIYAHRFFAGRKPEEIRFKPGDLIEIFCYDGNDYWSDGYVELAIVIHTPPTVDEMTKRVDDYLKTSKDLTGDRAYDLGERFYHRDDIYAVVAAYEPANPDVNPIDFCPTHCAMMPRMEMVSTRMRRKLERLRELVEAHPEWKNRIEWHC